MLSVSERENIERKIIGVLVLNPEIQPKIVSVLKTDMFSSSPRQEIIRRMIDYQKKDIFFIYEDEIKGDITDIAEELVECITKNELLNFNAYINILIEDYKLTLLYRLGQSLQQWVINDKPLDFIKARIEKETLNIFKDMEEKKFSMDMSTAVQKVKDGTIKTKIYESGISILDEIMPIRTNGIYLLAGNEGTYKTKFILYLMRSLLNKHKDISVLWYSMEDPIDQLIKGWISQSTLLTLGELESREISSLIPEDVKNFDIEFELQSTTIKDIGVRFKEFRDQRKDRFNILIVDNVMKIIPSSSRMKTNDEDMEIIREIESWSIKTDPDPATVILLHHFVKGVTDDSNITTGFKPQMKHVRGSGRYKDFVTGALLANSIKYHDQILKAFEMHAPTIKRLYTLTIGKNRFADTKTLHFAAFPEYDLFFGLGIS